MEVYAIIKLQDVSFDCEVTVVTKKKHTFLFITLSVLITSAALLFGLLRREEYNKDPDLSLKKPDSGLAHTEYLIPTSIEHLTVNADAVLIGTVTADDSKNPHGQRCAEIRVEKVLAGDAPDEFLLWQTTVGKDRESIVRTGERMLLILQKQQEHYKTSSDGVFYLDENDRLTSMSPFMICARYDGLSLDSFARDLRESYFCSAIGGSDEEWKAIAEKYRLDETFRQKRLDEWTDLTDGKDPDYEYAVISEYFK